MVKVVSSELEISSMREETGCFINENFVLIMVRRFV